MTHLEYMNRIKERCYKLGLSGAITQRQAGILVARAAAAGYAAWLDMREQS